MPRPLASPRAAPPTCAPPALLDVRALPERVQRMVALLVEHQALVCACETGSVELHFSHARVAVKVLLLP